MHQSRMRSIGMMMAVVALSISASAASASTPVEFAQPSKLTPAPAFTIASTQTHAVASAPASTQSFVCDPALVGRPVNPGITIKDPCRPPPPPPPPGRV